MIEQQCLICLKVFRRKTKGKYCCQKCMALAHKKNSTVEKICVSCKNTFQIRKSSKQLCCSKECLKLRKSENLKKLNPTYNPAIVQKIRSATLKRFAEGAINGMKGKKRPDLTEYNKRTKHLQLGDKNPNWNGGTARKGYGSGFNKELKGKIIERDEGICQICQKEDKRELSIHHIDYDKENNSPFNLISLCMSCHSKTNFNRDSWKKFFESKVIERLESKYEIDIMVTSKDRHSEVGLLIQSLRTQQFKKWNLFLLDDSSGTPITSCHFVMSLIQRLQLEGHSVRMFRNDFSRGVCAARNKLIEEVDKFRYGNLCLRLDDDVLIEPDYIKRLVGVIESGYDAASGVVPLLAHPELIRDTKFVIPIINYHEFDNEGNIIKNNDDCGYCYIESRIIKTHQFRTNLCYKREVTEAGVRYPDYLTKIGFREEAFFSFEMLLRGFTLAVETGAIAYHIQTQSGGCRSNTYAQDVQLDDITFRNFAKARYSERGNFL